MSTWYRVRSEQYNAPLSSIVQNNFIQSPVDDDGVPHLNCLFSTCCFVFLSFCCVHSISFFLHFHCSSLAQSFTRFLLLCTPYSECIVLLLVAFAATSATASRFLFFRTCYRTVCIYCVCNMHIQCAELVHLIFHSI